MSGVSPSSAVRMRAGRDFQLGRIIHEIPFGGVGHQLHPSALRAWWQAASHFRRSRPPAASCGIRDRRSAAAPAPMSQAEIITSPATRGSCAVALAAIMPPMLWPATKMRRGSRLNLVTVAGSRSQARATSESSSAPAKENLPGLPQAAAIMQRQDREAGAAHRLGEVEILLVAGKAVEQQHHGMGRSAAPRYRAPHSYWRRGLAMRTSAMPGGCALSGWGSKITALGVWASRTGKGGLGVCAAKAPGVVATRPRMTAILKAGAARMG